MNKINFTLLTALLLLFIIKSGHSQQTKWQTEKYNNLEDLSKLDFLYDSQGKLFYILTNDKDNIYIHIRAANEVTQKKIIIYGFNIEVKTKGASKKKLTIEYPLPKDERMEPNILLPDNSDDKRNNFNLTKSQIVKQIVKMRITGLTDKKSPITISAANNKLNINGNMAFYKNGDLQYSLVIPLNSLGIDLSENMPIKIKMWSGHFDVSASSPMRPNGMSGKSAGGRSPGMGGGQYGGGRGQGAGVGGAKNIDKRMLEKRVLSTPIKITLKKVMLLNENNL